MGTHRFSAASLAAALVILALTASVALATIEHGESSPKNGTFSGKTASGKAISLHVKKHEKVKVNFCDYAMSGKIKKRGKFSVAHNGPGGVYVAVKGNFTDKKTAAGTIPTDFLCEAEGEGWSATK